MLDCKTYSQPCSTFLLGVGVAKIYDVFFKTRSRLCCIYSLESENETANVENH